METTSATKMLMMTGAIFMVGCSMMDANAMVKGCIAPEKEQYGELPQELAAKTPFPRLQLPNEPMGLSQPSTPKASQQSITNTSFSSNTNQMPVSKYLIGVNPVTRACAMGTPEDIKKALKKLKEEKGNVNDKDANEVTPLMCAAANGKFENVKYLVEKCNADILIPTVLKDRSVELPVNVVTIAAECRQLKIVEYLLLTVQNSKQYSDVQKKELYRAIALVAMGNGDQETYNLLTQLKMTTLLLTKDSSNNSLTTQVVLRLHQFTIPPETQRIRAQMIYNYLAGSDMLIKYKSYENTPLGHITFFEYIVKCDSPNIVNSVSQLPVNLDGKDKYYNYHPLYHYFAYDAVNNKFCYEILKVLLNKCQKYEILKEILNTPIDGKLPLQIMLNAGLYQHMELMIKYGARPDENIIKQLMLNAQKDPKAQQMIEKIQQMQANPNAAVDVAQEQLPQLIDDVILPDGCHNHPFCRKD